MRRRIHGLKSGRRSRWGGNDCRQSTVLVEQQSVVSGLEQPRCKPRSEQHRPEPVATADKVMAGVCSAEAGVKSAEDHVEVVSQNIG